MEMKELYIPSSTVRKDENLGKFYAYYRELSYDMRFQPLSNKQFKDYLIKKAVELGEPKLKEYIENSL